MDIQMPIISMENSIELKAEENMITRGVSMFLRGIGTLLVILAHYSQWYVMVEGSNIIWYLLTKLGRYGVAVFFLVSGYGLVFSAKKGVTTEWIIRRVMHVYFPYLVNRRHSTFAGRKTVDLAWIHKIYFLPRCLVCVCHCLVLYCLLVCMEVLYP